MTERTSARAGGSVRAFVGLCLALTGLFFMIVVTLPWAEAWPFALAVFLAGTTLTSVAVLVPGSGLLGRVMIRGDHRQPRVALTWDDGPDPDVTPALLDLLAEHDVRGTFFLVGERAARHPELVRAMVEAGHEVGNHSWSHGLATNLLSTSAQAAQMQRAQAELGRHGPAPRHYRPPFGLLSHSVVPACARAGLRPVCWDVRSWDTRDRPRAVVERVLTAVGPGSIVLLHDGGRRREDVLDGARGILEGLAERGLEPVRVDELLPP